MKQLTADGNRSSIILRLPYVHNTSILAAEATVNKAIKPSFDGISGVNTVLAPIGSNADSMTKAKTRLRACALRTR